MKGLHIKKIRKEAGLSQTDFGKIFDVSLRTVQNWESLESVGQKIELLINSKYAETSHSITTQNSTTGTPYYDVDFTASFLEVVNDQQIKPDSYISHPFFRNCDFVVRASGQSMAKVIKHGDAIGLVKVENWKEFLPLGEIYAIVTNNGFRMIKIITKGETKDAYTLKSKPTHNKTNDFPEQQIKLKTITSIFKVQASSHLF